MTVTALLWEKMYAKCTQNVRTRTQNVRKNIACVRKQTRLPCGLAGFTYALYAKIATSSVAKTSNSVYKKEDSVEKRGRERHRKGT